MSRFRKSDIEYHSEGYGEFRPAVNVKVYRSVWDVELPLDLGRVGYPQPDGSTRWEDVGRKTRPWERS